MSALPNFGVRPEQLITPVSAEGRLRVEVLRDEALRVVREELAVYRTAKEDLRTCRTVLHGDWLTLFRSVSQLERLESSITEAASQYAEGRHLAAPLTLAAAQDLAERLGLSRLLDGLRDAIGGHSGK